jgi:hypothetical protein
MPLAFIARTPGNLPSVRWKPEPYRSTLKARAVWMLPSGIRFAAYISMTECFVGSTTYI